MFSEAVIKHFYVFKGVAAGSIFVEKDIVTDCRCLVSAIEGFLSGVVIAVTFSAHALLNAEGLQHRFVIIAGILASTVTVMD